MQLSAAQEFVYVRTYARWLPALGRREQWSETVDRYVSFLADERGALVPRKVLRKIAEGILSMSVMPSMRLLWAAGDAARADNVTAYNCAFAEIDAINSFSECLYILMCGAGYGFSVTGESVAKLPRVPELTGDSLGIYVIPDSKEGWAESVKQLMTALYAGKNVDFVYSRLRPRGSRLITMGGRSSGPAPLIQLHAFIREVFDHAQGRNLTTLECHDICNQIAEIVVVGGVRRSSQISLSDLSDEDMRSAKDHPFPLRRAMANNSAIYTERPRAVDFLREWAALAGSGTGERGIFNLAAARACSPVRRDSSLIAGVNPCSEILLRSRQFCVAGNTKLHTKAGIYSIAALENETVDVWNGKCWSEITVRCTRQQQPLVRVTLSDGSYLDCTEDHGFSVKHRFQDTFHRVNANDLLDWTDYAVQVEPTKIEHRSGGQDIQNAYTLGMAVGDGHVSKERVTIDLYGAKINCPVDGERDDTKRKQGYNVDYQRVVTSLDPDLVRELKHAPGYIYGTLQWSRASFLNFLAGWLDADGSETGTGGVRLHLSGEDRARALQLVLTGFGIRSSVCLQQEAGAITNFGPRSDALWYLQITECQDIPCHRLDTSLGHTPRFKGKYQTVVSVEPLPGLHDVYCFNEPQTHKALFNNVLTYQCNLSEVVVRPDDDLDSLLEKVETATWIGAIQSTFTNFPYLGPRWRKNCEEERLLGVSITGQMDNPSVLTADALRALKARAVKTAKHAAGKLGISMPAAITCVKPSGTVSQLVDSASGLHPRYARHYLRRYRVASVDPIVDLLGSQGFPLSPENGQSYEAWEAARKLHKQGKPFAQACSIFTHGDWSPEHVMTWVATFPQQAPRTARTRDQMSALDQLEWYKHIQTNWCEHNASCTVYVRDEEWFEVGNWVYANWDVVNGVSFLPYDGGHYEQMPYEEIGQEEYMHWNATIPKIDFTKLSEFEKDDMSGGSRELACVGGVCEI